MRAVVVVVVLGLSSAARAEPHDGGESAASDNDRPHAIYIELFGKGGLWGLGYDYQLAHRFAIGSTASYYVLAGDRYATLAPYASLYPLLGVRHRGFVQLGPEILRHETPSSVPEWNGMASTSLSGELSTGYEYRNRVLVRIYAMLSIGAHPTPWLGFSVGWTL